MHLLLVSEGRRDIGGAPEGSSETPRQGAVRILVKRTLESRFERPIKDHEIETDVLPRVHERSPDVTGYERKVELAIREGEVRGCTSVAIVVDRDGSHHKKRLDQLARGRERASDLSLADHTALGLAIETVEAWLLADVKALNEALSLDSPESMTKAPETIYGKKGTPDHPKTILQNAMGRSDLDEAAAYDGIAERADLATLEKRCPKGFKAFADELREKCR